MATPIPPPDPARDLLSYIPVYQVVVGTAVLLAAAGIALAVVPALRRRRELRIAWVLIVSAFALTILGSVLWILMEPSLTDQTGIAPILSEPLSRVAIGFFLLAVSAVALAVVPSLRHRRALVITCVLGVGVLVLAGLVNLGWAAA